jgi:ectoine hydroxylase-related dioxygenase (phytanoyl-CoA dioxygenase family)
MAEATATPLQAVVVKGTGGKGGFGGSTSSSSSSSTKSKASLKTQAKALAKVLQEEGVVRVDNVLSTATADAVRSYVYERREESLQMLQNKQIEYHHRFADVLLRDNRCDMPIPLGCNNPCIDTALYEVLVDSPVAGIMTQLLTDQAVLYELSTLISDPGSQRQVVHPDTPYGASTDSDVPVLYTCFIALQDITLDMGPTTWLPRTHNKASHIKFYDDAEPADGSETVKDTLLRTTPSQLGMLPKGACAVYDSRVLHCGTANQSTDPTKSRALFYFSFKNPNIGPVVGSPGSIRRDMIGQWTLTSMQTELKRIAKGKPTGNFVSKP